MVGPAHTPISALRDRLAALALTLGTGTAGGVLFHLAGAPAAFLTGSAVAVLIPMLLKLPTELPDPVRTATFAILGVMMGAGITPDALDQLANVPVALVGLVLVIVGATAASYQVLRRFGGWDPLSALCGSIPGNFSLVMAISLDRGARMDRVVMAQATRLFILVALVPFALGGSEAAGLRTTAPSDYGALDVLLTLVIAFGAAAAATAVRLPAPTLLGPLLVSTVLSATGEVTIAVPGWLAAAAFVILGASIAVRFAGVRQDGLRRMLVASLASFLAAFAVALGLAFACAWLLGLPVGAVFLAYAPGGLDAMIALSFLLHYEVAFVAVLHTARMIILTLAMPVAIAFWVNRTGPSPPADAVARTQTGRSGGEP